MTKTTGVAVIEEARAASRDLAPADPPKHDLKGFLSGPKAREALERAAGTLMSTDRLIGICLQAAQKSPKLLEVEPIDMLKALIETASLGLEPIGRGGTHLVPRYSKNLNRTTVDLIIDYRGEMKLAYNSGLVASISAETVRENDLFEVTLGDAPTLTHIPDFMKPRGKAVLWYAIAHMKEGPPQRALVTREDIDRLLNRPGFRRGGPWETDFDAMAKKTAVRRLCNMLPMSATYHEHVSREFEREQPGYTDPAPVQARVEVEA